MTSGAAHVKSLRPGGLRNRDQLTVEHSLVLGPRCTMIFIANGVVTRYDDPHSIACLVFFLLAALVTIRPIPVPVLIPSFVAPWLYHLRLRSENEPFRRRLFHLNIDLNVGPIAAVIILLASKSIGITQFRAGIKGVGDVRPYDILLLFLSLAYIAISLDATGALRFLAFWVAKRGGTSGWKLHFYLFLFFLLLGGVVGNDPVILSGTAFLSYFTQACGIKPPTAWIFSQFMAANLSSMVFVSSNPTNLIISSASQINFIYFSGWTILPAIFAAIALYPMLMLQFFRIKNPDLVPRRIETPDVYSRGEIKDMHGAIFKAVLLAVTLLTLIISSVFVKGLLVWWVTVPAAVLALCRDISHDWKHGPDGQDAEKELQADEPQPVADDVALQYVGSTRPDNLWTSSRTRRMNQNNVTANDALDPSETFTTTEQYGTERHWTLPYLISIFANRFPTVYSVTTRMPWPLLPFAFSFFILVDSLSSSGWITVWAGWMSAVVQNNDVVAIFFVGFICILLCNISTNIGATLILVNTLYDSTFTTANPSVRVQNGALFAVAIASNIGAYSFVFPASLAGLLWRGILKQKGAQVSSLEFLRYNFLPLVVTTTIALAVVVAEVRIIFPND